MPSRMNPYGVGQSREHAPLRTGPCQCCHIEFEESGPEPKYLDRCSRCQPHDASTSAGHIRMLQDHAARYLEIQKGAREIAREKMEERAAMQDRMISALRSRDRWRRILEEIEEIHTESDEGCLCGIAGCDIPELIRQAHEAADRAEQARDDQYRSAWDGEWKRKRELDERFRKLGARRRQ